MQTGTPGQTVEGGDSGNRNFVGQPTREIEGSVFIVSRPGENKKLALVSVRAFQAERAKKAFAQIQANVEQAIESISVEAQPAIAEVSRLQRELESTHRAYRDADQAENAAWVHFSDELLRRHATLGGRFGDTLVPGTSVDESIIRTQKMIYAQLHPELLASRAVLRLTYDHVDAIQQHLRDAIFKYDALVSRQARIAREFPLRCFSTLSNAIAGVQTDADGQFKLPVPRSGDFVIAASTPAPINDLPDPCLWIIPHPRDDAPRLLLSNHNLATVEHPGSIVKQIKPTLRKYSLPEFLPPRLLWDLDYFVIDSSQSMTRRTDAYDRTFSITLTKDGLSQRNPIYDTALLAVLESRWVAELSRTNPLMPVGKLQLRCKVPPGARLLRSEVVESQMDDSLVRACIRAVESRPYELELVRTNGETLDLVFQIETLEQKPQRARALAEPRATIGSPAPLPARPSDPTTIRKYAIEMSPAAKMTSFGSYDAVFIAAVQKRWFDILDARNLAPEKTGRVVIEFKLGHEGKVTDMKIAETDLPDSLSWTCQRAILDPAPYAPFSGDLRRLLNADHRDIRLTFYFN